MMVCSDILHTIVQQAVADSVLHIKACLAVHDIQSALCSYEKCSARFVVIKRHHLVAVASGTVLPSLWLMEPCADAGTDAVQSCFCPSPDIALIVCRQTEHQVV